MRWDVGLQGLAVLAAMALGFGLFAQLLFWSRRTRWVWLMASVASFAVGAFISEGLFGWATQAELQPNIDGLSFDEVLIVFALGIPIALLARFVFGRRGNGARSQVPPEPGMRMLR